MQLASAADGSMRDARSLLDQAIGHGGGAMRQDAVESMLGSISREGMRVRSSPGAEACRDRGQFNCPPLETLVCKQN